MKEYDAVRFRFFGDRHKAQQLHQVGRKYLGEMKHRMAFNQQLFGAEQHTTETGVVYQTISNRNGLTDIDEIRIYVPPSGDEIELIPPLRVLGFIININAVAKDENIGGRMVRPGYTTTDDSDDEEYDFQALRAGSLIGVSHTEILVDPDEVPELDDDHIYTENEGYGTNLFYISKYQLIADVETSEGSAPVFPTASPHEGSQPALNSWTYTNVVRNTFDVDNNAIPVTLSSPEVYTGGYGVPPDDYKLDPIPGISANTGIFSDNYDNAVNGGAGLSDGNKLELGLFNGATARDIIVGSFNQRAKDDYDARVSAFLGSLASLFPIDGEVSQDGAINPTVSYRTEDYQVSCWYGRGSLGRGVEVHFEDDTATFICIPRMKLTYIDFPLGLAPGFTSRESINRATMATVTWSHPFDFVSQNVPPEDEISLSTFYEYPNEEEYGEPSTWDFKEDYHGVDFQSVKLPCKVPDGFYQVDVDPEDDGDYEVEIILLCEKIVVVSKFTGELGDIPWVRVGTEFYLDTPVEKQLVKGLGSVLSACGMDRET